MKITNSQLETLRSEKGKQNLSIGELAKRVGINRYTMGTIINGKTMGLNTSTVNKIDHWLSKIK